MTCFSLDEDNCELCIANLTLSFGSRILIESASTSFPGSSLTSLIGRNGTGKSTLLRAIAGLNHHYSGEIYLAGNELRTMHPIKLARNLAFVSTRPARIPAMRCRDIVAMGRAPYTNWIGSMQKEDEEFVMESLKSVGMLDYADRTIETMSDGECQRIMIARALAQNTPIILLDEPTSFLDMPSRYELVGLLSTLAHEKGKCIIFSTHELDIATRYTDSVALIDTPALIHLPAPDFMAAGHLARLFPSITL